jgi:hypothetical protein
MIIQANFEDIRCRCSNCIDYDSAKSNTDIHCCDLGNRERICDVDHCPATIFGQAADGSVISVTKRVAFKDGDREEMGSVISRVNGKIKLLSDQRIVMIVEISDIISSNA